jgi:hypothetical protein
LNRRGAKRSKNNNRTAKSAKAAKKIKNKTNGIKPQARVGCKLAVVGFIFCGFLGVLGGSIF